jgi:hypothetical protein
MQNGNTELKHLPNQLDLCRTIPNEEHPLDTGERTPAATIQRYDSMKACSDPIHQELRLLRNCILFTINLILNHF